MQQNEVRPVQRQQSVFATTHWSIAAAAAQSQSPEAGAALEVWCQTYWFLLYASRRRSGYGAKEAADATQEFFAQRVATRRIFRGITGSESRTKSDCFSGRFDLLPSQFPPEPPLTTLASG